MLSEDLWDIHSKLWHTFRAGFRDFCPGGNGLFKPLGFGLYTYLHGYGNRVLRFAWEEVWEPLKQALASS